MATKQNTSFTEPNDEWLTDQAKSKDSARKAEATDNQFSEKEREYILAELKASKESVEKYGWVEETLEEMLASFKAKARRNGKI